MAILDSFYSLFRDVNRNEPGGEKVQEGVVSDLLPELTLDLSDDDLLELAKKWENRWQAYEAVLAKQYQENENYWLGKQYRDVELSATDRPLMDNRIFVALETFLPIATRQNPEPMVTSDNTPEGEELAQRVRNMLVYQADTQKLKLKLKQVVRFWAIYQIGCVKVGWDYIKNDIATRVLRPTRLILDPEAAIEDGVVYKGYYVGEHRKDTAKNLLKLFPAFSDYILDLVRGEENIGTELDYIEYWTDEYVFWKLKNKILGKAKNPHWNYPQTQQQTNEFGQIVPIEAAGKNHFETPQKPFIFLSIFNLGTQPHDSTSLIRQNLGLQDLVNKRMRQIDLNADSANGVWIGSGEYISKEELAKIKGRANEKVWIASGDVNSAIRRDTGRPLPDYVYGSLADYRNEIDNIFGTHTVTRGEESKDQTVRGKIITKSGDIDRIGGGITEYVEQVADQIFNWWLQLIYVYYDEEHTGAIIGKQRALEYISLKNADLNRKLLVSVKEGSLIPRDSITKRNEAIDLWNAGALDPITLFERLEFPNPRESAALLYTWKAAPQLMFPDIAQQVQASMAQAMQAIPVQQGVQPGIASVQPEQSAVQKVQEPFGQVGLGPLNPNK